MHNEANKPKPEQSRLRSVAASLGQILLHPLETIGDRLFSAKPILNDDPDAHYRGNYGRSEAAAEHPIRHYIKRRRAMLRPKGITTVSGTETAQLHDFEKYRKRAG